MANRPRAKEGNQPPAVDVSVLNVAPSTTASGAASGAAAASQVTPAGIEKPPVTAAAPTQTGKPRSNALPSTQTGPGLAQQSTGAVATTTPVGPIVVPKSHSRNKALQSGRFAINTYLWHPGGQYADATGSILSQSLEKMLSGQGHSSRYVGDLTMGQLRKLVPGILHDSLF
jgi:flagellar hook-length control protein FliK